HAVALEEEGQQQHEEEFRGLSQRLNAGGVAHVDLVQELVGALIIERERYADEDRGEEEDGEIALAQHLERIEAEEAPEASPTLRGVERRGGRQGEAVDAEEEG